MGQGLRAILGIGVGTREGGATNALDEVRRKVGWQGGGAELRVWGRTEGGGCDKRPGRGEVMVGGTARVSGAELRRGGQLVWAGGTVTAFDEVRQQVGRQGGWVGGGGGQGQWGRAERAGQLVVVGMDVWCKVRPRRCLMVGMTARGSGAKACDRGKGSYGECGDGGRV